MGTFLDSQRSKRLVAAALGPAFWVLGIDSWVSHYAGKSEAHFSQLIPVVFGAVAGLALVLAAIPDRPKLLNGTLTSSGVLASLIGLAGTYYHGKSLVFNIEGAVNWTSITEALAVAAPPFAPGAFIGVGGALIAMGLNRVAVRVDVTRGAAPAEQVTPELVPSNVAHLEPARKSAGAR